MINNWKRAFYQSALDSPLQRSLSTLLPLVEHWNEAKAHADAKKWAKQLSSLPQPSQITLDISDTISISSNLGLEEGEKKRVTSILKQFMPWRKGPFNLFGVHIDTEWRSDLKWQRIHPHISSLQDKHVLDVGCGSGYHLFRMLNDGAKQVIGVDPTALFFYQFHIFKQYLPQQNIHFLPLGIEDLPATQAFDTVFSMGVLYHRLDPLLFLHQLKQQLKNNGELVLETLVVEGDEHTVFMPSGRYAQMRNVYFLPSALAMQKWLIKVGFKNVRLVDDCITTIEEQRSTEWMTNLSLQNFLDPIDHSKTIEGYSAPRRATFIATK